MRAAVLHSIEDPGGTPVRRGGDRRGGHGGAQARGGAPLRRHPRRRPRPAGRALGRAHRRGGIRLRLRGGGHPQTIRAAWAAARRGGTVVIVGAGRADQQVEFTPFELLFDGKKMLAALYGSADTGRDYARMLGLWRAGRLDLEGVITQRLKLDDIDQALAALGDGDVVRQVISYG